MNNSFSIYHLKRMCEIQFQIYAYANVYYQYMMIYFL